MPNDVWAVVVARIANGAKSRLAPVLSPAQRRSIALSMLSDVLRVASRAVDGVVAVVDDADARREACLQGALAVDDPHPGDMNAAIRLGVSAAQARGAQTVIVLPADIPLISGSDLESLLAWAGRAPRAVVIGASRDGDGTNALLLRPPDVIAPSFGPPSVHRHVQAGITAGAFTRVVPGLDLALDVDTPADLAALAQSAGRAR
jgi:2-phospho-L-lactate/phosphoenolpyruvate guanylyltransferase